MQPLLARSNLGIFKFSPWTLIFFRVIQIEWIPHPTNGYVKVYRNWCEKPCPICENIEILALFFVCVYCVYCVYVYVCARACVHVCWWEETSTCHMLETYSTLKSHLSPEIDSLILKSFLLPICSTSKQGNTIWGAKWGGLALWLSQVDTLATKPCDLSSVPGPTAVEEENTPLYIILWPPTYVPWHSPLPIL